MRLFWCACFKGPNIIFSHIFRSERSNATAVLSLELGVGCSLFCQFSLQYNLRDLGEKFEGKDLIWLGGLRETSQRDGTRAEFYHIRKISMGRGKGRHFSSRKS